MNHLDEQVALSLEKSLSYTFTDKSLLARAMTHRSYVNENRESASLGHNERLEFLGDAVLELITTSYLYERFPESPEGDLTAYRSSLVNSDTLAQVASELGVGEGLRLSRGEAKDAGRARTYILANTFEAILGAVYLDGGYEAAKAIVHTCVLPKLEAVLANKSWIDSKSLFQARAQEFVGSTPSYRTTKETGPDHDKKFTVGVFIGTEQIATGEGKSKQEAELAAARKALEEKGWL
jgi:ribonuclease-3